MENRNPFAEAISGIVITIIWLVVWIYFTANAFFDQRPLAFALWLILGGVLSIILIFLTWFSMKE